jgi:hypothetical protein
MGHRRWILSNDLGPIGIGSTDAYSCLMVIGGSGAAGKPWQAWPPAGPVPYGVWTVSWETLDETGWTVQSDPIELGGASVSVSEAGTALPVDVNELAGGYGSSSALRFRPRGWSAQPGHVYSVSVGSNPPIAYDVDVVACP